jgi:hypothetical protein
MERDEEIEAIIHNIRESTFGHGDDTAIPIIDGYIEQYPFLLDINNREWYYKNC